MVAEVTLADLVKCIQQPVLTVARNVKFLSSRKKADQCTAETVTQRRKDTKPGLFEKIFLFCYFFCLFFVKIASFKYRNGILCV